MSSVQFYGADAVVKAYKAREIDVWGIFDGKELNTVGESEQQLTEYLQSLGNNTAGVYTLRFYPQLEDSDDVTPKEEYNGSFKFKLTPAVAMGGMGSMGGIMPMGYGADPIYSKLQGIVNEEVSEAIDRRLNGKGKEKSLTDVVMGLLEDPEKLMGVIGLVKHVFSGGSAYGAVAGFTEPARRAGTINATEMSNEEKLQRLTSVLDRLEKCDPQILLRLEKLADLAEGDPDLYALLIKKLNAI